MTDTRFQEYHFPAHEDAPDGTPDSVMRARVSDGKLSNGDKDVVQTASGERTLSDGDVVVEIPDSPGVFEVIDKDTFAELGWQGEDDNGNDDPADDDNDDDNDDGTTDYSGWTDAELREEIDNRNADRDDDAKVSASGKKADRAQALADDDTNNAE